MITFSMLRRIADKNSGTASRTTKFRISVLAAHRSKHNDAKYS
jgi:hypothetical protein